MDVKIIHTAYSTIFWATLFSMFEFSLQIGVFKISTDIIFIVLMLVGTQTLRVETKNRHFKAAEAGAWAMGACYAVFFVLNTTGLDWVVLEMAKVVSGKILLIWIYTQILVGSGTLLPAFYEKMKKTADLYAVLMCALTLAMMVLVLINGSIIAAIIQIFLQIWMMENLNHCLKCFAIPTDITDEKSQDPAG